MSVNALSMLALKVAPNTFDLSTGMEHVSLRDQVIRGTLLVRDLVAARQLIEDDELLIVGAGAAGVSAALQATAAGCRVTVIDVADRPFSLQHGVTTRYVGPYLYEWPAPLFDNQHLPPQDLLSPWSYGNGWSLDDHPGLRFPLSDPMTGDELATFWTDQLKAQILALSSKPARLRILLNVDPRQSAQSILDGIRQLRRGPHRRPTLRISGRLWPNGSAEVEPITVLPKFVIIATGFGPERTTWSNVSGNSQTGAPFWQADDLGKDMCGFGKRPTIAVLGGGDGALQDVLRCLFSGDTPLAVWTTLTQQPAVRTALDAVATQILAIEQQHASVHVWSNADQIVTEPLAHHQAFQEIVDRLALNPEVRSALYGALRPDVQEVLLVVREGYLGKAYSMNRFFIMLLAACERLEPVPADKAHLLLMLETNVHDIRRRKDARRSYDITLEKSGGYLPVDADFLSIRYGVDQAASPGQMLGITRQDTANRSELRAIPQPLWPLLSKAQTPSGQALAQAASQHKSTWNAKRRSPRPGTPPSKP